jgi:hypothetical protein
MTKKHDEFDEVGKRLLEPLRAYPALDTQTLAEERVKFLTQGESFHI